ncbi:MAG: NAD(P)-binding protein [Methylococcaceae bacterium]|nr:NAD(P)-binding protein [Methylococcaceae bacterium]
MSIDRPVKVAIIGSGCAAVAAAFELTRPEHRGKYRVTLYQMGWRMGGKGASGRGPADRIEEHGLHIWLGFYENAFRLLRECYAELKQNDPSRRLADWQDAFIREPHVGIVDSSRQGGWVAWTALFPPVDGLPGDPLSTHNPFSLGNYLARAVALLRSLFLGLYTWKETEPSGSIRAFSPVGEKRESSPESLIASISRLLRVGALATLAGLIEALAILEMLLKSTPTYPENLLLRFIENIAAAIRAQLEDFVIDDDEIRLKWQIIDLVIAILVGAARFRLLFDPRGLDAINDYECRQWLRMNGASEHSVDCAFVRGLYDLALAYEDGDPARPGLAAGQALRGSLRMFFTYRGALFWKMRAGMGDIIFAPFYEVLKQRGASVKFFHRLENVKLVDPAKLAPGERPYVEALEFDVQAKMLGDGEYSPLVDVKGIPSWPSQPDYRQLEDGSRMEREGWDFESHWDRRKMASVTLRVVEDFDFVVFGASIGAVPHTCKEILARDERWRAMVQQVKTVASQAIQLWMNEDMKSVGWNAPTVTLSAFVKPFDTWADMEHLIAEENWRPQPKAIAYFCNVLADPPVEPDRSDAGYPQRRREEVRQNAIQFLNHQIRYLWPKAATAQGFRWEILADPTGHQPTPASCGEKRFDTQYWRANVNPTDRYVLALPGSLKYRISPLDNTYDNLTIAGDWTDCGFNEGCVEAAIMSGRLAAHAIAQSPPLEDIIGYDHP